jgi:hypothetical protein
VEVCYFLLAFLKALEGKLNSKLLGRRVVGYIILWVLSLPILAFNTTKTLSNCKAILVASKEVRVRAEASYIVPYYNSK